MNDYRNRTKVNTAVIVREKIAAGQLPEDLADRIQRNSCGDPEEKEAPLHRLFNFIFTGRKRTR